jgi:hypothetical protein
VSSPCPRAVEFFATERCRDLRAAGTGGYPSARDRGGQRFSRQRQVLNEGTPRRCCARCGSVGMQLVASARESLGYLGKQQPILDYFRF